MGVVGFLVDVAVLLLGEGGLGEEGEQPIEVDQLEPALLHGVITFGSARQDRKSTYSE